MNHAQTIASFNGQILPVEEIVISPGDRSFLYGDSLFETVRVYEGAPFLWEWHMIRLMAGAETIGLNLPHTPDDFLDLTKKLIQRNTASNCIARLMVTRGTGERGYGLTGNEQPCALITLHPIPETKPTPLVLVSTSARVAKDDPLAAIKSGNKLGSTLAKRLAKENGADDGLILNSDGNITETSYANLFWIQDNTLYTPPLSDGVLPGVTRRLIIGLASALGQAVREESIPANDIKKADAVFVTSAATGIRSVGQVDGVSLSDHPLVAQLVEAYNAELARHATAVD